MDRTLIPESDWYADILVPLWNNNQQGIVLVKNGGNEYYVSGIYYTASDKKAYAAEHYLPGHIGVLDRFNKGPVSINSGDKLYLEQ